MYKRILLLITLLILTDCSPKYGVVQKHKMRLTKKHRYEYYPNN